MPFKFAGLECCAEGLIMGIGHFVRETSTARVTMLWSFNKNVKCVMLDGFKVMEILGHKPWQLK